MKTLIKNVDIVLPYEVRKNAWLTVVDGRIADYGTDAAPAGPFDEVKDGEGKYLTPGFIDTHVHGGGGANFRDATEEAFLTVLRTHLKGGTTTILPSLSSDSKDVYLKTFAVFNHMKENESAYKDIPHLEGIHMEGPYFSQKEKGAQDPSIIRLPDPAEYEELLAATPYIRRWAIACELPGAMEFGAYLNRRGICASVGHSNATTEQVIEAVQEYGFSCITHFYSGCSSLHRNGPYREGGVVEAGYLLKDLMCEVIGDGKHLPPLFLKLIYQVKGPDRICLITDCIRAGGLPYEEGEAVYDDAEKTKVIYVRNGVAHMPDGTCFAGSIATTSRLVKVMAEQVNVPLYEAVRMASVNPAKMLGIYDRTGSIGRGKDADLLLLNRDLTVDRVMVSGRWAF